MLKYYFNNNKNYYVSETSQGMGDTVKNMRSKTLPLRDLRAWFHGALDELGAFLPDFKNRKISFVCAGDMALLWAQGESSNPF